MSVLYKVEYGLLSSLCDSSPLPACNQEYGLSVTGVHARQHKEYNLMTVPCEADRRYRHESFEPFFCGRS